MPVLLIDEVEEAVEIEADEESDEAVVCEDDSLIPIRRSESALTSSYKPLSYRLFK
jgi:hypothetical protein